MNRKLLTVILPIVVGGVLVFAWIAAHRALSDDTRIFLPHPSRVLNALSEHRTELLQAAVNTTQGALIGLGSAIAISFVCALILSLSPLIRAGFYPYLMALQLTPVIVLAPLLVLWVGPGLKSVSIITFLVCFFPLVVNTTQGLISTDRNLVELFRMYRAARWQEIFLLRVPAAMPYFFTGLRIAATLAPVAAIVGDFSAGSSANEGGGLGFQSVIYSNHAKYPALFATLGITCILGFVLVAAVLVLSWLVLHRWHDSYERTDY